VQQPNHQLTNSLKHDKFVVLVSLYQHTWNTVLHTYKLVSSSDSVKSSYIV